MCRNTEIFLLQHLSFVINWKKSILTPVEEIEFLGLKINSVNLEIFFTEEKIQKVKTKCQNLPTEPETLILELTRVIGWLSSTIQAVLPARLQCRYLQLQQISSLKESHSYQQKIVLNHQSRTELLWWITNLDLCNGQSLIQPPAQVSIQSDASTKGWGGNLQWYINRRIEFNSRLGISKHFGLLRVDAESSNFSESLPNKGFYRDRFVCIPSITSDTNLCCMETRSSQSCNKCISTELVPQTPVCFSPILHDSKSSQQYTQGKSSQDDVNNPSLFNPSLVSKDFEHVNQESYFAALEKGPSEKSQKGNSSPSSEQDSKTGGLDGFRARLQEEGISKAASDLISKSRKPNSNANYELSWRTWASWCPRRETDSFSSNINEILD